MLNQQENDLLCRVEGDAAMGQIMRQHWMPACLSEEVAERDGDPVRVRLLGEDLVAFRDSNGRVGLVGENCPHRRASLVYGRNEECGLRCLYHGWKVDGIGNVVEMSSEPEGSRMIGKVRHKAYPTPMRLAASSDLYGPGRNHAGIRGYPSSPRRPTRKSRPPRS